MFVCGLGASALAADSPLPATPSGGPAPMSAVTAGNPASANANQAISASAPAAASANPPALALSPQIPPGTKITMQNWNQYRNFMPDGMIDLFEGKYFWKIPADVEMEVGPTVIHPLPKGYLDATEQNRGKTRIVELPGGGLTLANYNGGSPFPDPADPHKGWKILADFWFRYFPHFVVNDTNNLGFNCTLDSFGSVNCVKGLWVYRQHSYNTDPGVPATIPGGEGKFYTTWFMTEEPEQAKYSANLLIAYTDLTKPQVTFVFKPALRRSEQLSAAARCSSAGSDTTPDDGFFGFDGDIPDFDANLLGERTILDQMDLGTAGANLPEDYDMPLGWPKPSWGKWELRDTYVLDIRKIPAKASGYCYGKRIMYLDKQFYGTLWEDLYDKNMQLWKVALLQPIVLNVPQIGLQNSSGAQYSHFWNIQSNHATFSGPNDSHGYTVLLNGEAPKEYENIEKYTTPGGLNEIMR